MFGVLLMVLLIPINGIEVVKSYPNEANFRAHVTFPKTEAEAQTKYGDIFKIFAKKQYPDSDPSIMVLNVKQLQDDTGKLPIVAVQIRIRHKDGAEMFILMIKNETVLNWIDAGEAEEDEENERELFPGKEFA